LQTKSDGNFTDYKQAPIVTFEVDQTGTVQNVKIKRSSGSAAADKIAIDEVRHWKYESMQGCGTIQTQAAVVIDFAAP
jgi:TonB family protein